VLVARTDEAADGRYSVGTLTILDDDRFAAKRMAEEYVRYYETLPEKTAAPRDER
jgi:hypothetical protein